MIVFFIVVIDSYTRAQSALRHFLDYSDSEREKEAVTPKNKRPPVSETEHVQYQVPDDSLYGKYLIT